MMTGPVNLGLALLLLTVAPPGRAAANSPIRAQPVSLSVMPRDVTLWGRDASQQFLVLAQYADGLKRDVSSQTRFSISNPDNGQIEDTGRFVAQRSGRVALTARFRGLEAKATIRIEGAELVRPFSFARDIGGIFTKRGCNTSDCHGGVKGQGGLKLTKSAFQPREDYSWIVEGGTFQVLSAESKGPKTPRINLQDPETSLLLLKPMMKVPHAGGQRFNEGSSDYETILNWIRSGAAYGEEGEGSIARVEVFPKQTVLDRQGRQQLLVTAHLSNGRQEDITEQVLYVSNDPEVVAVSDSGLVRAAGSGETAVLIRAAGHAGSAGFGVIGEPIVDYPEVEKQNFIDEFVFGKLRKFNIIPSELSGDLEFLRRICLDLTGTLPPPARVREFLASGNPRKRDELIEILLDSPEYVDYWGFLFSDLMRATFTSANVPDMTKSYEDWIINSIAANKPYDQMAKERVAAQGYAAPARNLFHVTEVMVPEKIMAEHVRVFFGRRLDCAQCHNHPFENWSQNQFWGLTAFYGGLKELRDSHVVIDALGGEHVDREGSTKLLHPRTQEEVVPTFLEGTGLPEKEWGDPRLRLAEWMVSHPYFAQAAVNRMWGYLFGRGIVDPVDNFRATNPPSHPALLEALAQDFRDHDYDLRYLIRTIVQSRTYQLSGRPHPTNRNDKVNYSRARARPLEAAVLLDAISRVTGVDENFSSHTITGGGSPPPGTRAMHLIPDLSPSPFLDTFGRSKRKMPVLGNPEPNLGQALHMWAGATYTSKIAKQGGRLDRLLKSGASDRQIVEEFYLAALTRFPTPRERADLLAFIQQPSSRRQEALEGFVWALIGSREFAYNH